MTTIQHRLLGAQWLPKLPDSLSASHFTGQQHVANPHSIHTHLLICAQACMSPVQLKPRRLAPLVYIEKSYRRSPFTVVMGYISTFLCASSTKGVGDKGMRERRSLAHSYSIYIALPSSRRLWLSLQPHSCSPSMLSSQYNHSSIESCPNTEHLVTEYLFLTHPLPFIRPLRPSNPSINLPLAPKVRAVQ